MRITNGILITFISGALITCSSNRPITIMSGQESITIQDGSTRKAAYWILTPEANPDEYIVTLKDGEVREVRFITDVDSIQFQVEAGKSYDFNILWGDQVCRTRISGRTYVPPARFTEAYQTNNRDSLYVLLPPAYELMNIAIAISSFGINDKNFVYKKTDYYDDVLTWFRANSNHPFVQTIDSILQLNSGHYANLKMNGYSFEFDDSGQLIPSAIYNRTGFYDRSTNQLSPYFEQMRSFAEESQFLEFYKKHEEFYAGQTSFLRDSLDVGGMIQWLENEFPGVRPYDCTKIIFSPLVAYNQSSTWIENNGFRELHAHVNFPYRQDSRVLFPLSGRGEMLYRGFILFTELNHGYINPTADQVVDKILEATSKREVWERPGSSASSYTGKRLFLEYMNWGLVSLRFLELEDEVEQEKLIERIEGFMVEGRGFIRFHEFNAFLLNLYSEKGASSGVAELYSQIIDWFKINNY